jgi:acyl-CoA thioester hydrolase
MNEASDSNDKQITHIRVRYGETDQMGFVYYGVYPQYFEVGRAEWLRRFGLTYKELEDMGVIMPVSDMSVRYLRPAQYDDLLTVSTRVVGKPSRRITFQSDIYNDQGELLTTGTVTLAFVDRASRKTIEVPAPLMAYLSHLYE